MTAEAGDARRSLRRKAVGALAVAVPLAALAFAAVTWLDAEEMSALADRQQASVAAIERRVARLGDRAAPKIDYAAIYVPGDTTELARAELQKRLGELVAQAQGRLIETQEPGDDRPSDAPDDGRVDLRITFDARNDGLLDVLHAVETGLPLLTVERLEARRLGVGGEEDAEDPNLRIGLVVRGYRKVAS